MYTNICIHTHTHTFKYIHKGATAGQVHVHTHTHIYIYTYTLCIDVYKDMHTHTHTHIHVHYVYMYTKICIHTYICTHIQTGDGLWTCIYCASDGRGNMLDCTGRCRACETCNWKEDLQHVCPDRAALFTSFASQGVQRGCVCLPDFGKGKVAWKEAGLIWKDPERTLVGVRDPAAICEILDGNTDPLLHRSVLMLRP